MKDETAASECCHVCREALGVMRVYVDGRSYHLTCYGHATPVPSAGPAAAEIRDAWLRWPQHNPHSEHGLEHGFGVAWKDCVPCAIYAALGLVAK